MPSALKSSWSTTSPARTPAPSSPASRLSERLALRQHRHEGRRKMKASEKVADARSPSARARAVRTFLALADTSRRALACRAMCQPLAAPVQTFVAARALASRRCVKWRSALLLHARAPLLLFVILLAPRPAKTRETKHASDEVQVVRNRYNFRSGWRNEGMRKKVLKSRALQHFMLAVPPADVTQVAGPKSSVRPDPEEG